MKFGVNRAGLRLSEPVKRWRVSLLRSSGHETDNEREETMLGA
jgi:hypothetical protein